MSDTTYSLWKLLKEKSVVVPMIQRDYAQGRQGKAYIRASFLKEIKESLKKSKSLTLDFVYGNMENGQFQPLDGQQRLTTLWLVHWYLAFRGGRLSTDADTLKNFSYEIRPSSKDFCKSLCDNMINVSNIKTDLVSYIKSQTWFYSAWLQDPTISAMLTTIGGESEKEKEDSIEKVFADCDDNTLLSYRNALTDGIITFELMIIGTEKLPISDDLYVKMNARGKPLTNFENFKADLVNKIRDIFTTDEDKAKYAAKIDNEWTDVFWKNGNARPNIDEIYFEFINRYVLNQLCLKKDGKGDYLPLSAFDGDSSQYPDDRVAFDSLRKGTVYHGFAPYSTLITEETLNDLDCIFEQLRTNDHLEEINNFYQSSKFSAEQTGEETNHFIPQYYVDGDKNVLTETKLKERVYFYAVCQFLKKNSWDREKFDEWMRVVYNLTENAEIDAVSDMITVLRDIHDLSEHCMNIMDCLKNNQFSLRNLHIKKQLEEECKKAVHIYENPDSKDIIVAAEEYNFFKGCIRFLYSDGNNGDDWVNFETRFDNAKKYFNSANQVQPETIDSFLRMFECFDEIADKQLFTSIDYHNRHSCWKRNILNSDDTSVRQAVNNWLLGNSVSQNDKQYEAFLEADIPKFIATFSEGYKYIYDSSRRAVRAKSSSTSDRGVYISENKFEVDRWLLDLHKEERIKINDECLHESKKFLWGLLILFEYSGQTFCYKDDESNFYKYDKDKKETIGDAFKKSSVLSKDDLLKGLDSFLQDI